MRDPIVMTVQPVGGYEWPTDFDWMTVVAVEGRYQIRTEDWVVRNANSKAVVKLGLEPMDENFHPSREWGARAVRAARYLVPGF